MSFFAGVIMAFIMTSVGLEVIMRYFFNRPLIWVTEITECLLLYITFLGSAWLLREEGHVRVDIFINRLKPNTVAFLSTINSIIGVFISGTLTVYGTRVTWDYFQRGMYTPTAMELPLYAILLIIPIGSFMLLVQFLRRTGRYGAGFLVETYRKRARSFPGK